MKRFFKILGLFLLMVLLVAGGWVAYHWEVVSTFPGMPSAYEAKELCSCLFVEGRGEEECTLFVRQDVVPIDARVIDMEEKTVTVEALFTSRRARFLGLRYGCVLE